MRSWKTPALLATVGLCGLGSLFAQGPALPSVAEPTPASGSTYSASPLPADVSTFGTSGSEVVAPAPITESVEVPAPAPVYESAPVISEVPVSSSGVEIHSVPMSSSIGSPTQMVSPAAEPVIVSSSIIANPEVPQHGCACQGNSSNYGMSMSSSAFGGHAYGANSGYAPPSSAGPIYTIGSGSGVAAGVLTPNSNSGGLHTRYPYYSYRAPWYYQGPPSLNVTIVW